MSESIASTTFNSIDTLNLEKRKKFITSALPYVNGKVHAGNLIGSVLSGDFYARQQRKLGHSVMYLCGTDDYGSQTEHKALKEGLSNIDLCDKYRAVHEKVYKWFNISFDVFGKTPTPIHTELTQEIFTQMHSNNLLKERITEQYFCETCDRFVCDRFIHGTCYMDKCEGLTKGDECVKCCKMLDVDRILAKFCSICGKSPIKRETKHLYLDLAPYKNDLIEYFLNDANPKGIKYMSSAAKRVTKEWLNKDLTERCVTRDLVWGVKLPNFEGLDGYEKKVSWPWLDAPIGYISILANAYPDTWKEWINSNVDWIQFQGKDNVPFHTIIFPATLIGSGFQNLGCGVTHLSATEYLLFNGEKFSKSSEIGISGDQIISMSQILNIDEDYWRYYLAKIRPENADSTFTFEGFCDVIKGELAQKMGNLINRGIAMTKKYYPQLNELEHKFELVYDLTKSSKSIILQSKLINCVKSYLTAFDKFSYHEVISLINRVAEIGNEWINEQTLWIVCKNTPSESEYLMGNLLLVIWLFAELVEPVMPKKSLLIKSHFVESSVKCDELVMFDKIVKILNIGVGKIFTNVENSQFLFNQIKIEDIENIKNTLI